MPGNERGGKRPRAGRPAGFIGERKFPVVVDKVHDELLGLTLRHQAVIRLAARGKAKTEIAKEMGLSLVSIRNVLKNHPEAVQQALAEFVGMPARQAFRPLAGVAFNAFEEILNDKEHKDRAGVATRVHEYLFDKPITRVEHEGLPAPQITIISATQVVAGDPSKDPSKEEPTIRYVSPKP